MLLAKLVSRFVVLSTLLALSVGSTAACRDLMSSPSGVDGDPLPEDTLLPPADTGLVTNVSPAHYEKEPLNEGDEYYVDRGYTLGDLGQRYRNWLWIRTANDDKMAAADSFLTFELSEQAVVAVGYDSRVEALPDWLQDWTEAPEGFEVSDDGASPLRVFYRVHEPGVVVLGGNMAEGAAGSESMYVPLTLETKALRAVVVSVAPAQTTLKFGETRQFDAEVQDQLGQAAGGAIEWTATGGTITASGEYTAGVVPGTYMVTATEPATGLAGMATVSVVDTVTTLSQIVVVPSAVRLDPGGSRQFQAYGRMSNGDSSAVTVSWAATGGSITLQGLYSAEDTPGTYQVTATETATQLMGRATVVVRDTSGVAPPGASDFFVDNRHPSASDNNPGTEDQPWKTLEKAAATLVAGQTVWVKDGTYIESEGCSWANPALDPANSGTADNPIAFRAYPGHMPLVTNNSAEGCPPIGTNGSDYIIWDGFEVDISSTKGAAFFNTTGSIIENCVIHGLRGDGGSNTDGIRVENSTDVIVRNNVLYDIHNEREKDNAAGVKMYRVHRVIVENNEAYDVVAGMRNKVAGSDNVFRYNWVHDCRGTGIDLATLNGERTDRLEAYGNIVARCNVGIKIWNGGSGNHDAKVHQNTIVDSGREGITISETGGSVSDARVWNNILYDSPSPDISDSHSALSFCGYNLYWNSEGGCGQNNVRADPRFVSTSFANPLDFRLLDSSPALGTGRDGNNIGAYAQGNEIIGIRR